MNDVTTRTTKSGHTDSGGDAWREVVYSPESALKHPGRLFHEMLHDLVASRELAFRLAMRDIKALYRQSMLGYVWALIPPIAAALAFVVLRSGGVFETRPGPIPYPVFVLVGTTLWQIFVDATNSPLRMVTTNRGMLTKVAFPKEALIIAGLYIALFNVAVRLVVLLPVMAYYEVGAFHAVITFPIGVAALLLLGTCIGVLLSPVGMLYKDVESSLAVLMSFWMLITPVAFPRATQGVASLLMSINPATPLVMVTRQWLTGQPANELAAFACVTAVSFALLVLGWFFYRVSLPHVTARLGM